ncbi:S-phase kinase-associated protein 2 isoform X1 [Lepisosteus oculatus]|uniref:S-phase kinase-associated protein 2 isoform X1 n=2 Tax=Lepisosteus oculatus TaxID=7918 RepID=UPI003724B3BF
MSKERRHLQELPSMSGNLPDWTLSTSQGGKKGVQSDMDNENTPQDLIHSWSPPRKQQRICRGKENEEAVFVLARRPWRKKEQTGFSWDSLPDELLLGIFHSLPLRDLLRASRVCKRWHRLAFDESLWFSVDLEGKAQLDRALSQVLTTGAVALRCPRTFIGQPSFPDTKPLRVQHLDLSNCTVSSAALEEILRRCCRLQNLSLEGLGLSDHILQSLSQNPELVRLNMSGCSAFSSQALGEVLEGCTRLEELNASWCPDFSNEHIKTLVTAIPASVTRLNLSGYRHNLQMDDVKVLLGRCPNLTDLDLSDSVLLTPDVFQYFQQLPALQHLALSRCYQIHPAALVELEKFPGLKTLEVFGIVQDAYLPILKKGLPHIKVNSCCFTAISRPTPAGRRDRALWGLRCQLAYRQPPGL